MKLINPQKYGILVKRYKRFMADIKLESGEIITAHCANTGSMKSCSEPGWRVMVSDSLNPKRKLRYTWEMVHNERCWIGINTQFANSIVREAIEKNNIPELVGYKKISSEKKYGQNSRIDLLLESEHEQCFVEVKNVTLAIGDSYLFPDAVTERGLKHLIELEGVRRKGYRAVMFFLIQRNDAMQFKPCKEIDPQYSEMLKNVNKKGVEILPYEANVSPLEIKISHKVKLVI